MPKCLYFNELSIGHLKEEKKVECDLIESIVKNLPSVVGKEYIARFCSGKPDDCAYKKMRQFVASLGKGRGAVVDG